MIEVGVLVVVGLVALKIFVTPHASQRGAQSGISKKELSDALSKLPDESYGQETWVTVKTYGSRKQMHRCGDDRDSSCDAEVAVVKNGSLVTIRPTRKNQYEIARGRGVRVIE